ncbi:MAG: ribonuclease P protein component [Oscillospiraceae bacterium]|nr:ribonuclease P protein component [Oscillospiraceae bacterium]
MGGYSTLKTTNEFQRLFKKGRSVVTYAFICYYAANDLETNRLGVVASKKVGNAPARSRAKRILREAFRAAEPTLSAKIGKPCDFVFVARAKTPELKSTKVLKQINEIRLYRLD